MACQAFEAQITPFVDGELDPGATAAFEAHLAGCAACVETVARTRRARQHLAEALAGMTAPESLRARLRADFRASIPPRRPPWRLALVAGLAAGVVLGVAGGWWIARGGAGERNGTVVSAVLSAHIRSLQADHLTDVASSDHHTVKPWFSGKLDFAPPVPDLAASGFPLVGGRVDLVADHVAAALIYRHGGHVINVFVWPANETTHAAVFGIERGFTLAHGVESAMTYWVVSDLNADELRQFVAEFAAAVRNGGGPPQ